MDEILMLQEEITELQKSLAQELVSEPLDAEAADQLALQSTLTVLAERMATIRMKASGKRQLLEVQEAASRSGSFGLHSRFGEILLAYLIFAEVLSCHCMLII